MNKIIVSIMIGFFAQTASAMTVYYDSTTLDVSCWGNQDADAYLKEYPNLKIVYVKDDDPVLKNNVKYLRYKTTTGTIVKKSQAAIDGIESDKRKREIETQIRRLRQQNFEALQFYQQDGFDVSVETATIRQSILTLKQEYQSLP